MDFSGVWAGFGFESGGEILVGMSQQIGVLISIGDLVSSPETVRWMTFQQEAVTLGLGLGGAAGVNFCIGLNATTPLDFDGAPPAQFDFSLDLGLGLGKYLRTAPEMIELIAIANKFDGRLMSLAKGLTAYDRNAWLIKDATEGVLKNAAGLMDAANRETSLIGLPVGGGGLRASLKMKFETTDVTSWGAKSFLLV